MQGTIVILLALSGLGCQNPKEAAPSPPPPPGAQAGATPPASAVSSPGAQAGATPPASNRAQAGAAPPSIPESPPLGEDARVPGPTDDDATDYVAPPPYPVYSGGPFSSLDVEDDSFGTCFRSTFWSFFIGRAPNIPSAREIESAYRAGLYNY